MREISLLSGSIIALVVTSSVAKSISASKTFSFTVASLGMAISQSLFLRVDLPAFVYPIIDTLGISLLLSRCVSLTLLTFSSSLLSSYILSFICLLSTSSFFSPGPLVPIPPPVLDNTVPSPIRRGSLYLSCAISTCILASLLLALLANISSINVVLSITFTPAASSIFLTCEAVSSSSNITTFAMYVWHNKPISSTFPLPT